MDLNRRPYLQNPNEVREQIKNAARDFQFIGQVEEYTHQAVVRNPLCGDEIEVSLRLNSTDQITALKAQVRGCLVSKAAWSMTAKVLINKTRSEAIEFLKVLDSELSQSNVEPAFTALETPLTSLLSYRLPSPRHSCATLGSQALLKALEPKYCNQ